MSNKLTLPTVEKNVPIPARATKTATRTQFVRDLASGDSFIDAANAYPIWATACRHAGRQLRGRKLEDGKTMRFWVFDRLKRMIRSSLPIYAEAQSERYLERPLAGNGAAEPAIARS